MPLGDGRTLWVTDDRLDEVFVYDLSGQLVGRWGLDPRNADASGITNKNCKGNAMFADGHADTVPRDYAHMKSHAAPDPGEFLSSPEIKIKP